MGRKEILTDPQKLKFIEILLIVGAIISAFNLPQSMIWMFMLFILAGLFIFVILQTGVKNVHWYNIYVGIASICFSAVFTYLFSVSFIHSFNISEPLWIVIVAVYLFSLTYAFYFTLSKSTGGRSMLEGVKRYYGSFTIAGSIFLIIGVVLVIWAIYIYFSNNEQMRWSDILAIGLAFVSFGIALVSLGISKDSTKRLEKLSDSDYDTFVDNMENERFTFIREFEPSKARFMVEVVAWKSKQYFEKAIGLRELIIDKSKLRFLPIMVKQLAHLLLVQATEQKWIKIVWNRDVANIVVMYIRLWDTKVISYAEEDVKNELVYIFDEYIGERLPDEDDLSFFKRTKQAIHEKEKPNEMFERIITAKKQKKKPREK